jgi:hypothetical protein
VYNPNANWTAATNAGARAPSYYIAIDGVAVHYSTAPVRNAATTKKVYLELPGVIGQKVNMLTGRQSIQITSLDIVDRDNEMTDLIAIDKASPTVPTLINRTVTIFAGYLDLDEADFAPIAVAQIADEEFVDGNTLRLTLRDVKRVQQEKIFTNASATGTTPLNTFLTVAASAGEKEFTIQPTGGIPDPDAPFGPASDDFLYIADVAAGNEEKVRVADLVDDSIVKLYAPLVNSYAINSEVRWASSTFKGNPINAIYAIWTGDFGTIDSPGSASFPLVEVRGEPTGLGIAVAGIDTAELIEQRDRMLPDMVIEREIKKGLVGVRFLERSLYRVFGYPVLKGSGKLSLKLHRPAFGDDVSAGLPTITQNDILSWKWRRRQRFHVNRVGIGVDLNIETNDPAQVIVTEDTADQTATGEIIELRVDDVGFTAAESGVRFAQGRGAVMLRRFQKPPWELVLKTPMHKRALEAGDTPLITHPNIPNVKTGTRGLTDLQMEIVERSEDPKARHVILVLNDASHFTRPSWLGPAGALPTYDTATDDEKEEMLFVGKPGFPVPDFDDGKPSYEVN